MRVFRIGTRAVLRTFPLLLMVAATAPVQAQVVIYRCTDASGAVTLQNDTPCPKGSKQVKRVLDAAPQSHVPAEFAPAPAPPPAPVMTDPVPAAVAPQPVAPTPDATSAEPAPRLSPPPLFQCRTWEDHVYFSDEGQPPQRCMPVQITGLDGTNATAAGSACQMVDDRCQAIPEAALCDAWKERVRQARSQSDIRDIDQRERALNELEAYKKTLAGSNCVR